MRDACAAEHAYDIKLIYEDYESEPGHHRNP